MPARNIARSREAVPLLPLRPAAVLLGLLWVGIGLVPALGIFTRPYADLRWLVVIAGLIGVLALNLGMERGRAPEPFAWRELLRDPMTLGAALIGLGLVVSSIASPNPFLGLRIGARECFLVGTAWCLSRWSLNPREQAWLGWCLIAAAGFQAGLGLIQAFAGAGARSAIHGTMEQSEALADFVGCGAAAAAVAALGRRDRLERIVCVIVALIGAAAIFISGGRGGALAAIVALAIAIFTIRGAFKARWLAWGGGLLVLFVALYIALPGHRGSTLVSRFADIANPYSVPTRHRIGLITISSHMVLDRPFAGSGPGRFAAAFSETQGRLAETETGTGFWSFNEMTSRLTPGEAHCDPLQWWAEYGLLACLGLILMVMSAIIGGIAPARGQELWPAALWTAFMAFAIVMWVSYPLHDPMRALFFWSLLGLSASRLSPYELTNSHVAE